MISGSVETTLSNLFILYFYCYINSFPSSTSSSVRGRCSRWPVSEALPLSPQLVVPSGWSPPPREKNTWTPRRPFHRRGCRSEEAAGRGPLCGWRGRRPPHCLQRTPGRRQTLAGRCSSSLQRSASPWWPLTSGQHTWTWIIKVYSFKSEQKYINDNQFVTSMDGWNL